MRTLAELVEELNGLVENDRLTDVTEYVSFPAPKRWADRITQVEVRMRKGEMGKQWIEYPEVIYLVRDLAKMPSGELEYAFVTGRSLGTLPKSRDVLLKDARGTLFLVDEGGAPDSLEMETIRVKAPYMVATLEDLEKSGKVREWTQRLSDLEIITPFRQFELIDEVEVHAPVYQDLVKAHGSGYTIEVWGILKYGRNVLASVELPANTKPSFLVKRAGKAYSDYYLSLLIEMLDTGVIEKWTKNLLKGR